MPVSSRPRVPFRGLLLFVKAMVTSPVAAMRWLYWVGAECRHAGLASWARWLWERPVYAYLHCSLAFPQRAGLVRDHYLAARSVLSVEVQAKLIAGQVICLGIIDGRKESYLLELMRSDLAGTRQEGEIAMALVCATTLLQLCKLTFSLLQNPDGTVSVLVGGIQGAFSPVAKERVIFVTRDLWGLRPKDALLNALRGVAMRIGVTEILAVGNSGQIVNSRGRQTRAKMTADYDSYWTERGAVPDPAWGFRLCVKDLPEPATSKRDLAKETFRALGQAAA